jgi:hypothetical protein
MAKQRLAPWRQALCAWHLAPLLLTLLLASSPATAQQTSDCQQVGTVPINT